MLVFIHHKNLVAGLISLSAIVSIACNNSNTNSTSSDSTAITKDSNRITYLSQPLVTNIYTADPSAHVFNNKIYVYPSHDIDAGIPEKDDGSHFAMKDYHILSMDSIGGKVTDNGVAIDIKDIPWVKRQLWAPDAAYKNGTYYLYFPAKDKQDIFRIGVATSSSPTGPFKAEPAPIQGSYSIDRLCLPMITEVRICTSVASGAGSCNAGKPADMIQQLDKNQPIH